MEEKLGYLTAKMEEQSDKIDHISNRVEQLWQKNSEWKGLEKLFSILLTVIVALITVWAKVGN